MLAHRRRHHENGHKDRTEHQNRHAPAHYKHLKSLVLASGPDASLYFDDYQENLQPVTAQYSLPAGTLPTSTDPDGWHWAAGQGSVSVQLKATNIQMSQHEAYLGFVSGVLFALSAVRSS
jgi:hypothetical protein